MGRTTKGRTAALAALAALVPLAAGADVFLNGVNISGVTNQTFEKATVRIDEAGNVHIDAPGYAVSGPAAAGGATAAPAPAARATGRYYLVTSQSQVGATQYDIDLYVNAKWIRKLRNDEPQIVMEITRYLRPGRNRVLMAASKDMGTGRVSRSPGHHYRVVIGQGNEGGRNIMIERSLVDFKVTADQIEDVSREFDVIVQ